MSDTIACKSCKHIRFDWTHFPFSLFSAYAWRCDRIRSEEQVVMDPVFGRKTIEKSERKLCVAARGKYGECGAEATLWEPKRRKDFLVYLKRI